MSCPDYNPNTSFHQLLFRLSPKTTNRPQQRKQFYYLVCFFFRFSLYNLVFLFRKEKWIHWVVAFFACLSFFQLSIPTKNTQWWSKTFQWYISMALIISSLGFILNILPNWATPLVLYISLFGGLLQSLQAKFC